MSFLLRVTLPDRPGALGLVASALGTVGADIISVDVIDRGHGYAVDDLVVDLPPGRLPDSLVSAATSVEGVRVESIRPYAAAFDPNRELELIDNIIAQPAGSLGPLADGITRIFRAGWTLVLGEPTTVDGVLVAPVLARGQAAPEIEHLPVPWWPVAHAQTINGLSDWLTDAWNDDTTEVAATPMGTRAVIVGRPAMRWLPGELARLSHLAGIVNGVL